jgi:pimeloyl-ACP methyl ester carboxylesterase
MKKIAFDETKLTEKTSLNLVNNLQFTDVLTPLSLNPIETAYVQQGEGNLPIVLIYGFDSSLLEFRRLLPLLSTDYPTLAIDLLGFGFTARSSSPAHSLVCP